LTYIVTGGSVLIAWITKPHYQPRHDVKVVSPSSRLLLQELLLHLLQVLLLEFLQPQLNALKDEQ
jgi:hypothetical protein